MTQVPTAMAKDWNNLVLDNEKVRAMSPKNSAMMRVSRSTSNQTAYNTIHAKNWPKNTNLVNRGVIVSLNLMKAKNTRDIPSASAVMPNVSA